MVTGGAERDLGVLHHQGVDVIEEMLPDPRDRIHRLPELRRGNAERLSSHLHLAAIGRPADSKDRRHPDQPEAADDRDLDRTIAAGARIDRGDATFDEMNPIDLMMMILQDCPPGQRDQLQMRREDPKARPIKTGKDAISDDHIAPRNQVNETTS
jgi:hypothetical protein